MLYHCSCRIARERRSDIFLCTTGLFPDTFRHRSANSSTKQRHGGGDKDITMDRPLHESALKHTPLTPNPWTTHVKPGVSYVSRTCRF